ncbi:MAG: type 1 glutamine amidotransferase [Planctomycetota bacterium]|nr:type 1 glutamine amidotransferase [Planctomycetota bacterium]
MTSTVQYLLMQVRNPDDPMAEHEVRAFAHHLHCEPSDIRTWDLLGGGPDAGALDACDIVLIGGSGDYSVVTGGAWLESALDAMRLLHELDKPTFASCWGCQAMARAMGGTVVTDPDRAEVGTHRLHLTEHGRRDPVTGPLGDSFLAQMGHQDRIRTLPPGAVLLASSDLVEHQAWTFEDRRIYCTQFHPELNLELLLDRLRRYPVYVEQTTGLDYDTFVERMCTDAHDTDDLLARFVHRVLEN